MATLLWLRRPSGCRRAKTHLPSRSDKQLPSCSGLSTGWTVGDSLLGRGGAAGRGRRGGRSAAQPIKWVLASRVTRRGGKAGPGKVQAESLYTRGKTANSRVATLPHPRAFGQACSSAGGGGQEIENVFLTPRKKPPFKYKYIGETPICQPLCGALGIIEE